MSAWISAWGMGWKEIRQIKTNNIDYTDLLDSIAAGNDMIEGSDQGWLM